MPETLFLVQREESHYLLTQAQKETQDQQVRGNKPPLYVRCFGLGEELSRGDILVCEDDGVFSPKPIDVVHISEIPQDVLYQASKAWSQDFASKYGFDFIDETPRAKQRQLEQKSQTV